MAGIAFTSFGEAYVLNWLCHAIQPPKLNLWLGLLTSNPGESGTGVEVTGGGYARQNLVDISSGTSTVFGSIVVNTSPLTGSYCTNINQLQFPIATTNWGTITYMGIWDAATAGNMIAYKAVLKSDDINDTNQAQVQAGGISFIVD